MIWSEKQFQYESPDTIDGLVSIVLPTYNRLEFLKKRLEEINNQVYKNWELIIVNDGGIDVSSILNNVKNTRLINLEENSKSVSIPRNIGISYAKGEFICPADDDVVFFNDKLEILVSNIQDNILCYGNRQELYKSSGIIKECKLIQNWNTSGPGVDNGQIIYRKSCYDTIPYVVSTHACDYYLSKMIYEHFKQFSFVDKVVCQYIWHESNRTYSDDRKRVPLNIKDYMKYFNVLNDIVIIREK